MRPYRTLTLEIAGRTMELSKTSIYRIFGVTGLDAPDKAVEIMESGSSDGGFIVSDRLTARHIVIDFEVSDRNRVEECRDFLMRFLRPKDGGVLTAERNGSRRRIEFYIEARPEFTQINIIHNRLRVVLPLVCPDPFFYDAEETAKNFMVHVPMMYFPLTSMVGRGVTAGLVTPSDRLTLTNDGDEPAGIVCTVRAVGGAVVNPGVWVRPLGVADGGDFVRVERTLAIGDELIIDTRIGRKNIYVNGETFFQFDPRSVFFALPLGESEITVTADSGIAFAQTSVAFRRKFYGV